MRALVCDYGLTIELARLLAAHFGDEVGYFSPWASAFADPSETLLATGLEDEGVKRIDFPWSLLDSPDEPELWVFPDLYFSDWQQALRAMGKHVWGSGPGELFELDRWKLHESLKKAGLKVADSQTVEGTQPLYDFLSGGYSERAFVKLSQFYRGAAETYEHKGWPASRSWFEDLSRRLGPAGDSMRFMLQKPIAGDSVEPGIDLLIVNGQNLYPVLLGYEEKDSGMISKVTSTLPKCITEAVSAVINALSREAPYTNFFSGEMRITEQGDCYFLDATCRMPRPGDGAHQNLCKNLPQIIDAGARSAIIHPDYKDTICCQLMLNSPWAKDHPLHVRFPEELRDKIKLYYFYRDREGEYWILPHKMENIVAVVTTGNELAKVKRECLEIAKAIEADGLTFEANCFDKIEEQIEQGQDYGVSW